MFSKKAFCKNSFVSKIVFKIRCLLLKTLAFLVKKILGVSFRFHLEADTLKGILLRLGEVRRGEMR